MQGNIIKHKKIETQRDFENLYVYFKYVYFKYFRTLVWTNCLKFIKIQESHKISFLHTKHTISII